MGSIFSSMSKKPTALAAEAAVEAAVLEDLLLVCRLDRLHLLLELHLEPPKHLLVYHQAVLPPAAAAAPALVHLHHTRPTPTTKHCMKPTSGHFTMPFATAWAP